MSSKVLGSKVKLEYIRASLIDGNIKMAFTQICCDVPDLVLIIALENIFGYTLGTPKFKKFKNS
jgi:hypothetical protein